ncbi:APC family permease [Lacticaseibacillus daqingensis]|uniref:APC family permease n=1 Tax=Lacticaseibacillus daqingensis TaxID=2486014 RepID=UPI000F7B6517|nr:APC family permease [Lacticaseibacillus daqingensis]
MRKVKAVKEMSFGSVLLLGINGIIGSGIFLLPGTLFKEAGRASVWAIVGAGAATTLIALCYAVMASRIDDDGGAWAYADRAFGPLAGFMTGWFGWFLGVITIAAELAAFLTALGGLWPAVHTRWVYAVIALSIIGALTAVNWFGPGATEWLDNGASAAKVVLLAAFIGLGGWAVLTRGAVAWPTPSGADGTFTGAFATAFYMFTGFSFLPVAAKAMRDPEKTLPRALLIVMVAVTAVYAVVQLVTMALLGGALAGAALPVAAALAKVLGNAGRVAILVGMLVSILGVAIAVSFDTPVGMAALATEKHLLPAVFGRTNRFGAPAVAILTTMALAAGLVLSGSYLFLVKLIVLSSFVQYIATILAMLKLRRAPALPAGMHLPASWGIALVALGLIAYLMTSFAWLTWAIGLGTAAVGGLVFWLDRRATP